MDPDHEHDWQPTEIHVSARGADQAHQCGICGAVTYEPGQAALRDDRPPLR